MELILRSLLKKMYLQLCFYARNTEDTRILLFAPALIGVIFGW